MITSREKALCVDTLSVKVGNVAVNAASTGQASRLGTTLCLNCKSLVKLARYTFEAGKSPASHILNISPVRACPFLMSALISMEP